MASDFALLLDATLRHVADLESRGVRWVTCDPAVLDALATAAGKPARKIALLKPAPAAPASPRALGVPTPSPLASAPPRTVSPPQVATPAPLEPFFDGKTTPTVDREAAMAEIRQRALGCQKCPHLVRSRTQVVFGVGRVDAELMFVGEAPGAEEDRQGEPFVGPAGQLLTKVIQAMGYTRGDVYIANILKCRPDMPLGSPGNRPPRVDEMDTCKPYLLSQIEIVQPRVIVALGATAVLGLLGIQAPMGSVRGRWHAFRGIPVMATYHPSYLVRSERSVDRGHSEKRKTWEDMLLVLEKLGRPITEKMRRYFQPTSPNQG